MSNCARGDLTDGEALEALKFDVRWWYAFEGEPHEMRLCRKTPHNFRERLLEHKDPEKKKLAFRRVTDELIEALGGKVDRPRLDSKHILSNFAVLTRLGLFCETIRVFLREVKRLEPKAYEALPAGILKRHGEESCYGDARRADGPRRLAVVARDTGRLVTRFEKDKALTGTEGGKLVKRLFEEQCEVKPEAKEPGDDEDDRGDGATPVELKPAKQVGSDSLQTPHDAGVTYSGHKGKGYEVQVAETVDNGQKPEMITEVEVTRSCGSDAKATVPIVEAVVKAGHKPSELVADTGYSSGENAAELVDRGVNLLAPAPAKPVSGKEYPAPAPQCPKEAAEATIWLREQEASPKFLKRYAIRAGSEATNSELARAHGMRKLRVRGEARVNLSVYFKALACNVKRSLRWWLEPARGPEGAAVPG